jgi:homoserine O-acetyltransferase/O-succinyltransferase
MALPAFADLRGDFPLVLGGSLRDIRIRWEEWGRRSGDGGNTIVVFPALSAHSHLRSHADDSSEGWWEAMVGPGRAIDTDRWHVLCASLIGSPYGSTSPLSIDPSTGRAYGPDFPQITPADLVRGHKMLLDALGIRRVHAVVGASLGGMQVLQFAADYPDSVGRFIALSMTAKTMPHTVALRRIGRQAILTDPAYARGRYEPGKGPYAGLKVAREIGTILYRSRDEFNARFRKDPVGGFKPWDMTFEVESYLAAHGERFAPRFDANCYLLLSKCMDLMDLGFRQASLEAGIRRIKAKGLIIGVDHDALIPIDEQQLVGRVLRENGNDVRFETLSSVFGHDAFLKEFDWQTPRFRAFFEEK